MNFIFSLFIFFLAVVIHEYAHGWVAYRLGDYTAKYAGRLTLNPLAHIDPFGTIILPILLVLTQSPVIFGWAKPVPIDYLRLGNPKKDIIWVALAGPAANIVFALFLTLLLKINLAIPFLLLELFKTAIVLNLVLAVFNLVPIPPLDGSRILMALLPYDAAFRYAATEQFGFIILFVLLLLGLFDRLILPIVGILIRILGIR